MAETEATLRLAELIGSLSLATDLGMGQPFEKAIRSCVGQAEDMADTRLRSVTVNLTCGQPESRLFNVQWPVGGRAVTEADIRAQQIVADLRLD